MKSSPSTIVCYVTAVEMHSSLMVIVLLTESRDLVNSLWPQLSPANNCAFSQLTMASRRCKERLKAGRVQWALEARLFGQIRAVFAN
jgi:hypothetical protein